MTNVRVATGANGAAILHALHRHGTVSDAMLDAFDLLELNGCTGAQDSGLISTE
jgi:hypothetical protein